MDKEKRIQYLIQACELAAQKWDELTSHQKAETLNMSLEASVLSSARSQEVFNKYEKLIKELHREIEKMDELNAEMDAELGMYDVYLAEKGLTDDFEAYIQKNYSKPHLHLVQ